MQRVRLWEDELLFGKAKGMSRRKKTSESWDVPRMYPGCSRACKVHVGDFNRALFWSVAHVF